MALLPRSSVARFWFLPFLAVAALAGSAAGQEPPLRLPTEGVKLEGNQFLYDAGFEVFDWDGDGKQDVFLPNTSMMSFAFHLNEGTAEKPRFGRAVQYPVNLTETVPQPIEHTQAFAVRDLDHDGLFDLVVFDGQLRLLTNVGTRRGPNHWNLAKLPRFFPGSDRMVKENARYATGPESMHWRRGVFGRQALTFVVADWDGDGLDDLLVCRFRDEAPGVTPAGGSEQWTGWGRVMTGRPRVAPPPPGAPTYHGRLSEAPARELHFYKNVGTKTKPWFDQGVEIKTPDGKSLAAPNPVVFDVDGDGALDLVSTETEYACNAFRVDWPTKPTVTWLRRPNAAAPDVLEAPRPLLDAKGQPVPAGVQARLADLRGKGERDLLVMDAGLKGTIRWYRNAPRDGKPSFAPAETLRGRDFLRFDFMAQPLVTDWFGTGSRDLVLHGCADAHCMWSLRRTALYKNVATKPGELRYEQVGHFNYRGDPRMVGPELEDRHYDVYGSFVTACPRADGEKRLLMSVAGRLYLFSGLAEDGLTFRRREALDLSARRNRCQGWQEIPVKVPEKVKYLRIGNDRNGMGNLRDSFLHVVRLEALAGGKNWATVSEGATVHDENKEPSRHYRVQRPTLMLTPDNVPSDQEPRFSTFGYYIGPAVVTLREPVALEKIRFLLSDREDRWFQFRLPYYWQGKLLASGYEAGEPWYQYTVEVSADGRKWTKVADTMEAEMMRACPCLLDWDGDGKTDLLLGVLNGKGIWPATKEYRLYRNAGTNANPRFEAHEPLCDEKGKPIKLDAYWYLAYGPQCGVCARDFDGDGKPDLVLEGFRDGELIYYQNLSADAKQPPRFRRVKELGHPAPLRYDSGYRYFHLGDVDGDGVADLLNSASAKIALFKGVRPTAPERVEGLALASASPEGVELRWRSSKPAERYEVRWGREPVTELNWPLLAKADVVCRSGPDGDQVARLTGLPAGEAVHVACRAWDGERASSLSESLEIAVPPLRRLVLRNGPEGGASVPAYAGCEATYLDAGKPTEAVPRKPSALTARAQRLPGEKQKVILVRFKDLPAGPIERATLELTTDPGLQANPHLLQKMALLAVSCSVIRDNWDAARATFAEAAPGRPWAPGELDAGGTFQSFAELDFTVRPRRTLRWDVTEAVRAAQKAGRQSVSLLVRVDYTGPYVAGAGYTFCGSDFPAVELRPRLCLDRRE